MNKLKKKWGITSDFQFVIIFIVFAITGSLSAFLSKPVTNYIGLTQENLHFFLLANSLDCNFSTISSATSFLWISFWTIHLFLVV
jgi:hypothetical protein